MAETNKHILFLRTDSIGDSLIAASMLPFIAEKWAGARISVFCQGHVAAVYEKCPHVQQIMTFDKRRAIAEGAYREEVARRLASERADLCINSAYSRDPVADFFALASGARECVAFAGDSSNIRPEFLAANNARYTRLIDSPGEWKSELERARDFLRGLGIEAPPLEPTIWTGAEDREAVAGFFRREGIVPEKTIALFASAQFSQRVLTTVGSALAGVCRELGLCVVALGAEGERGVNQYNLASLSSRGINLSGKTGLRESAEILRACRLAVGTESGLAHLACAVGRQNVIVLGGGHFGRFMPYSPLTTAVCFPMSCYGCNWQCRYSQAHCVKDVVPEVIEAAIRDALERKTTQARVFMQHPSFAGLPAGSRWELDGRFCVSGLERTVVIAEGVAGDEVPAGVGDPVRVIRVKRSAGRSPMTVMDITDKGRLVVSFGRVPGA